MLRRFRGIKPTHLWHLTSKKDFQYVLNRRLNARQNFDQRDRKDFIQLVAIVLASSLGMLYMYGQCCPKNNVTTLLPPLRKPKDPPTTTTTTKNKVCPKIDKSQPCPPQDDKDIPKPCPKS